jgi:xanthine dehydrogenase iron-sulfur cluster and FAD-binding subunit A
MPRVIRAMTRPPGPTPRAAASENRLGIAYAPGILLTAHAFLLENPSPTQAEIREALAGNLYRCTGYHFIVEAIKAAAQRAGAGRLALNPQEET